MWKVGINGSKTLGATQSKEIASSQMDLLQKSFPRPMWYTQFLNSTHLDPLEDHQEVGDQDVAAKREVLEEVHGHADDGSGHVVAALTTSSHK